MSRIRALLGLATDRRPILTLRSPLERTALLPDSALIDISLGGHGLLGSVVLNRSSGVATSGWCWEVPSDV